MDHSKKIRIALAGGGSGGHVYPLLAVMETLRAAVPGYELEFSYFGRKDSFSEAILDGGARLQKIAIGKWRRYFSILNFLDIPKFFWSCLQCLWKLFFLMPDAVFSKGGPGALPVVFAAWFYRIPVLIHDSDALPGVTNLLSGRFARKIAISFEASAAYFNPKKTFLSGNPVRAGLLKYRLDRKAAKEKLGFDPEKPLLLVICGSQGAERINEFIVLSLKQLLPKVQVYHQTGPNNFTQTSNLARAALLDIPVGVETKSRYQAVPYLDQETGGTALSAADVTFGRAGGGTISEIAAFGRPSILVPLAHQRPNAEAYAATGAARVIEDENLNINIFGGELDKILAVPETAAAMSAAAAAFYRPDAAEKIAAELLRLAGLKVASNIPQ